MPAMGRLHVVIDDELHKRAKAAAAYTGRSLRDMVEQLIEAEVDRVERAQDERRGVTPTRPQ